MADLPTITWTAGVPDTGQTGTVMTVSQILGTGPKTLTDIVSSLSDKTQFTKITDGSNTAAVKAASTAAVATDPAVVVALSPNGINPNGQAVKASSAPMVPASDWVYNTGKYVAVAASQTDAVIQASTGAAGDYLDHVVVVPATTAAGVVTIKDNATALISYPGGGTTALLTLTPFTIYVGAVSSSGAWKITTGANVSILAVGRFS